MPSSTNSPYSLTSLIEFTNRNFALILLVVLTFIGGFAAGALWQDYATLKGGGSRQAADSTVPGQPPAPQGPSEDQLANVPPVTEDDHIRGSIDAPVILIEYSDLECPFCARFHPTMTAVMEKYGDQVAWVYRHFPLSFHPLAEPAAVASECVAEQQGEDAFWSFTDEIFEMSRANGSLAEADIQTAAEAVGANWSNVESCMDSGRYDDLVANQMSGGQDAGVSGTPGTIVMTQDGQYEMINGALPQAQVEQVIEQFLN